MNLLIGLVAWVTVSGFPVASFETCAMAEQRATELQQESPDLQIRAECNASNGPESRATIDYYGPGRKTAGEQEPQ